MATMPMKEFARRRAQLMRRAGPGSVIIVCAAPLQTRNADVHYPYRQDSDFLYLTGFEEPNAVLVLLAEKKGGKAVLFCRQRDPKREMWDGPIIGPEGAVEHYDMDQAWDVEELGRRLPEMLHDRERILYDLGKDAAFDQRLIGWLNEFRGQPRKTFQAPDEIIALDHMLHDMRLYKSRSELAAMRRSAKIAAEAHTAAMRACRPGLNEADMHAELLAVFTRHHCEPSYQPIVGGGANACVLHYIENDDPLEDGHLLLIDAGAEHQGYASDITRTFPVNGRFTDTQRALYDCVLHAQLKAIDTVRPGASWDDVHDAAAAALAEGMIELGLIDGPLDEAIEKKTYDRYFVHKTGHWLGLDVHDVGEYQVDGHSRELEPGMVLTIEPGLYIPADDDRVDARWRGIGIRIEDDVVVTGEAPEVLSEGVPKTVDEIEALMRG